MTIEELQQQFTKQDRLVIAIEGPSGSGKSTLSKRWEELYNATVFHTDDYFLSPERKTKERLSEAGGNLDYERMLEEVFHQLDQPQIVSNHFNCKTNVLEHREAVELQSIIIVEGVYSMHPLFMPFYNYTIFLDLDYELQKKRILARSNEVQLQRYMTEWIPLENRYFTICNCKEKADVVEVMASKTS